MAGAVEESWKWEEPRQPRKLITKTIVSHCVCGLIIVAIWLPIEFKAPVYCSDWDPLDPATAHPVIKEAVPVWAAATFVIVYPPFVFLLFAIADRWIKKRRMSEVTYVFLLGLVSQLQAVATCVFITAVLKRYSGVKRPNFLGTAIMKHGYTLPQLLADPSIVCYTSNRDLQDAQSSFPSGQASNTMAAATVVCLYVLVATHAFRRVTWHTTWINLLFGFFPIIGAALIAVARVRDYTHHPIDVTGGSLIGIACGCLGFAINFMPYYAEQTVLRGERKVMLGLTDFYRWRTGFVQPGFPMQQPQELSYVMQPQEVYRAGPIHYP